MAHSAPVSVPIPQVPEGGVDENHDLSPKSPADRKIMEELISHRPVASELKDKGILKGVFTWWRGGVPLDGCSVGSVRLVGGKVLVPSDVVVLVSRSRVQCFTLQIHLPCTPLGVFLSP
jgi:hypothetical protein